MQSIKALIQRHPVATYFSLVFLISWGSFLVVVGPKLIRGEAMQSTDAFLLFPAIVVGVCLVGIVLTSIVDGRSGLRDLFSRVGRRTAVFDVADEGAVRTFFEHIGSIDHVLLAAGGPFYAPFAQMNFSEARRFLDSRIWSALYVARYAVPHMVPAGSLIFLSGTQVRRPALGLSLGSIVGHAIETLTENFALGLAPIRVNTIACGFVDTPLSAALLGEGLQARREELERTLPIHRVVQPEDVAKLAVHLMLNTAITWSTYAIDGGQSLL